MDGLTLRPEEITPTHDISEPIEKNLDSPLMHCSDFPEENVESVDSQNNDEILPNEELDKPLNEVAESERPELSEEQKESLKVTTGWSDQIIDSIKTESEALVYADANLKEVNGNLERTDIDWDAKIPQDRIDRIRSLYGDDVANKWDSKTNMDLIKDGKAPYGPDGQLINLHHIGQTPDSPLAELTNTEHKQYDGVLHDKTKKSEIERPIFQSERKQYWQDRFENLTKN